MRKKACLIAVSIFAILMGVTDADASPFWVANDKKISPDILKAQLLVLPQSLKYLGQEYTDGWSIAFYKGTTALVARSEKSSTQDEGFDKAVQYAADTGPNIVIGHLQSASFGCKAGAPNPHPFQRFYDGKNWLFGHNGGLNKELLVTLIGEEYLQGHPPQTCTDNPPTSWADSELYFIFLLKHIEAADQDVRKGLENALKELTASLSGNEQSLNFFLTDGKNVWAFRKGTALYYTYDRKERIAIISSSLPGDEQFEWKEFPEDNLALLRPRKKPVFYALNK